jgi:hypothetical protein
MASCFFTAAEKILGAASLAARAKPEDAGLLSKTSFYLKDMILFGVMLGYTERTLNS